MARIISTTAITNWIRIKLNQVPSPDGDSAYGRFYLLLTGQHATRLPDGSDWLAAKSDHTHSSELPSLTGNANKYLQVKADESGTEWDTVAAMTDHGSLTGLLDDDHPQYHNDARGDARYAPIANSHVAATVLDSSNIDLGITGQQITADLKPTTVVAGSYSGADITVDANGRLTSAATGANNHAAATVLDSSNIDLGITGQQITADLKTTTVSAGTYASADITVDAYGRLTSAATGANNHVPVTVTDSSEIDFTLTGQDVTASLKATTVSAGTYSGADITVDSKGRITAAATGANNHVPVTVLDSAEIDFTLSGQQVTADLKTTTVVAGTYALSSITVDSKGRITAASMGYAERAIVTVSSSKTLALSDRGTKQLCASASAIQITVPTNASVAFPVGTEIDIFRNGAGAVSVSPVSGAVTIRTAGGSSITAQWRAVHLTKIATDEWVLIGAV